MLLRLKLINFKRHELLELNFTGGLQVIRGLNEAGKSTLFDAVGYAYYGSRALPLSLDETVTWGKPVASLRVELDFVHNRNTYSIYRTKNGAELKGEGVTASGQAEVTAFIEKLFGASASVGMATMLANQGTLKDSLNSSSMPLIEKLANMQLIDTLVSAVQEKLPSGNTKNIEAQLASYTQLEEPLLDTSVHETALALSQADLTEARARLQVALDLRETLSVSAAELATAAENRVHAISKKEHLEASLASAKSRIQWPVFDVHYDIPALTLALDNAKNAAAIEADYKRFQSAVSTVYWGGTPEQFIAKHTMLAEAGRKLVPEIARLRESVAAAKAMLITETACGLCGKDLTAVPEVVAKNSATNKSIADYLVLIDQKEGELGTIKSELAELQRWDALNDRVSLALPINHVEVDATTVPPTLRWVGPEVGAPVDVEAAKRLLDKAQAQAASEARATAVAQAAEAQAAALEANLAALVIPEIPAHLAGVDQKLAANNHEITKLTQEVGQHRTQVVRLEGEIQTAKAVHAQQLVAWEAAKARRAELMATLDNYAFNNGIIKKLREARPIVAKKLWTLVLTQVSRYFSAMRGTVSTVTRNDDSFAIDGKKAAAYSGSTKDVLGFAIRLTLQKTFLPNVGFMLVDEPGAACDDTRESEMLGILASCGMDQVILVTHSELADSFAANVLTI